MSRRVLVVEDEDSLILTLEDRLAAEGYEVAVATDGEAALHVAGAHFDCIILDVALPKMDGFEVCRELRRRSVVTPILMLTARSQVADRVLGLKLGADDYLTKPFDMAELLARVEALLRRSPRRTFANVVIDFERGTVNRSGLMIDLSQLELKLLRYFMDHPRQVITREELLAYVWGYRESTTTRTVDVHIASLRQKVEEHPSRPEIIVTVHGEGYKFMG
jgi:two-component system alkaline phosphatase synthesis response regulator PhoP